MSRRQQQFLRNNIMHLTATGANGRIPISERLYYEYADELLCHIRELVEHENGINFTGNAEIAIVLTEEEFAEFMANIDAYSKCRKLYIGHDLLPDEERENSPCRTRHREKYHS